LKVFLFVVVFKIIDSAQPVVNSLLLKKLLKWNKLHFLEVILCETSFGYDHVLMWVSVLKLYDFPVIRIERACFIHVTKLFRHLSVYSIIKTIKYFNISMKSFGVKCPLIFSPSFSYFILYVYIILLFILSYYNFFVSYRISPPICKLYWLANEYNADFLWPKLGKGDFSMMRLCSINTDFSLSVAISKDWSKLEKTLLFNRL